MKPLRGVNLGGWLILEPWMTPSLFAASKTQDEYTFMTQDPEAAVKIDKHRRTFVTAEDFAWLGEHLEAVRLPVGYWVLDKDDALADPYLPAVDYLDWAMDCCAKNGLAVLLDIHGLPGSQNGWDHSGQRGKPNWYQADYMEHSLELVTEIARHYRNHPALWGFQVINEPLPKLFNPRLRTYYRRIFRELDHVLRPETKIVFSDAFKPRRTAWYLRHFIGNGERPHHQPVMDIHFYHMTSKLSSLLPVKAYLHILSRYLGFIRRLSQKQGIIVGEWSGVLRGRQLKNYNSAAEEALMLEHFRLQRAGFGDNLLADFYWNYKTEDGWWWDYRWVAERYPELVAHL